MNFEFFWTKTKEDSRWFITAIIFHSNWDIDSGNYTVKRRQCASHLKELIKRLNLIYR